MPEQEGLPQEDLEMSEDFLKWMTEFNKKEKELFKNSSMSTEFLVSSSEELHQILQKEIESNIMDRAGKISNLNLVVRSMLEAIDEELERRK